MEIKTVNKILFGLAIVANFISCMNNSETCSYNEKDYIKIKTNYYEDNKSIRDEFFVCNVDTTKTLIKSYYENGVLRGTAFYLYGMRHGPWLFYDDNGVKFFEGFFKNGLKDSTHKIFHNNGKLYILENYKDGKEVGNWYYYDSFNSTVLKVENY